jgi:hypothetical protein
MKKIVIFSIMMLAALAACTKDQSLQDESVYLKKARVPIPMKADFCLIPDMTLPPVPVLLPNGIPTGNFLPGGGLISGHATHMGEIITSESPITMTGAVINPVTWIVTWTAVGKVTADNGDYYYFHSVAYQDMNKNYTGTVWMHDGTGNFDGVSGSVEMIGQGLCWKASGTIQFD